jgi:hypothetical protein
LVEVELKLVRVVLGHEAVEMLWSDVVRIEAGREPRPAVDIFYVQLRDVDGYSLIVDDLMNGFQKFEAAMFSHWPSVAARWKQVFTGPPDEVEKVVLWQRES